MTATFSSQHNCHYQQQRQRHRNPLYYPDVLSPAGPTIPSDDQYWTHDFVIRSLRRRLWKAFQDDDAQTALRAYSASLLDFQQWLQEEEHYRIQFRKEEGERQAEEDKRRSQDTIQSGKSKDPRGSFLMKRKNTKDSGTVSRQHHNENFQRNVRQSNKAKSRKTENVSSQESLRLKEQQRIKDEQRQAAAKQLELLLGGSSVSILESLMNPSEPFIADDFLSPHDKYEQPIRKELPDPIQHAAEQQAVRDAERRRQRERRPRLAFRRLLGRRDTASIDDDDLPSLTIDSDGVDGPSTTNMNTIREDKYMTTPLHEAARLGAGDFVRFLLANAGDPNMKNGQSRTSLHMCAGGLTEEEDQLMKVADGKIKKTQQRANSKNAVGIDDLPIGIRAVFISDDVFELMHEEEKTNQISSDHSTGKSRGFIGRLFGSGGDNKGIDANKNPDPRKNLTSSTLTIQPNPHRLNIMVTERMDAMLTILSWVQKDTGEGPSINAVDADGRTALHYAAEMGRSDVCVAILSNFGAMLTIVDDLGARTPCELAAAQGHKALAAQLEARAVLYIDPYGLDDDLMENMPSSNEEQDPRERLVPPFKWFQTLSMEEASRERSERLQDARAKMLRVIEQNKGGLADSSSSSLLIDKGSAEVFIGGDYESAKTSTENMSFDKTKDFQDSSNTLEPVANESRKSDFPSLSKLNASFNSESLSNADIKDLFKYLKDSHVERYLTFHKWENSDALKAFRKGPLKAFEIAGVPMPRKNDLVGKTGERLCQICYDDDIVKENWMQLQNCQHGFCMDCLRGYVQDCAEDKMPIHSITCPHHECKITLFQNDLEKLLENNPNVLERLYLASTEHFVATASDMRFCPHPGCTGTVHRLPQPTFTDGGFDARLLDYTGAVCVAAPCGSKIGDSCTLTYEGVEDLDYNNCHSAQQPRKGHRFCFACSEGVHWPVTCERLGQWKLKVKEEIGEVNEKNDEDTFNDLAQRMWLKANTRPCPECNVPIEKNDGCNHMTCTNQSCLHEFCWICRKDWKLHGTATGGFFRCNIWQEDEDGTESGAVQEENVAGPLWENDANESDPANDEGYGTAIYSAREAWRKKQEMNRFIHHYTRWEAHGESAALERKMSDSVCTRLAPVVEAAMDFDGSSIFNFGGQGLSFVHSAFTELLECRSVLKHSYAFSYFRYPAFATATNRLSHLYGKRKEKIHFERIQSELEVLTEQMSDIVARSHLRATQTQISFLTAGAAEKRVEFSNLLFQIYKEEKRELERYKQRKLEQEKYTSQYPGSPNTQGTSRNITNSLSSLTQLMTMHQLERNDDFEDHELSRALDTFLARAGGIEQSRSRRSQRDENDINEHVQMWACARCTFVNNGGRQCAMCNGSR